MRTQRLSLITLPVDDLGAAIDFYQQAMGWDITMRFGDEIAFVQMNGFVAALWSRAAWEAADAQAAVAARAPVAGIAGWTVALNSDPLTSGSPASATHVWTNTQWPTQG